MVLPSSTKRRWGISESLPFARAIAVAWFIIVAGASSTGPAFSGQFTEVRSSHIPLGIVSPFPDHAEPALSKGRFLVATHHVRGSLFAETVILLIDYSANGAMGLIVNRPAEERLSALLPDIEGLKERPDIVYFGGPVTINQMFLLIRSAGSPEESVPVFGDVYVSSSRTTLEQMLESSKKGDRFRVYAGYAGWAPQQLDQEVARGDWHVVQADAETIFTKDPSDIWPELFLRSSVLWAGTAGVGPGQDDVP